MNLRGYVDANLAFNSFIYAACDDGCVSLGARLA